MDNIDRKYKLPPPLPTIQNGKPQPIYPLMLEHKGDNNQLFAGKYVGEIEHIYDLFYKLITCQSIDENNPLEHEAKIHNNNFYIYQNGKWVLIGDIRKPYFGAIDYMESTFDKQIDNLNYLKNEFQEIAKDGKNEINSVIDEARNINLQINDAARIVDEASLQAQINAKSVNIRQYKNIETMKQSTNVTDDLLIATQGFIAAGDGGNAQYYVMPEDSEEEADGYSVIDVRERISGAKVGSAKVGSARTTAYKNRKIGLLTPNFVDVRWFGAKLDGVTDDSDAFNRAVKFLVDNRKSFSFNGTTNVSSGTLYVPKGIMKINKAIEIDAGCMGVYFDGTIIDATEISTDYAVRLYSSTWSHLSGTAMHNLFGLILRGNRTLNKIAILYDGVPQFNTIRSFISGFSEGIKFSNNCYIYNFIDVVIDRCEIGINNPKSDNAGEKISFTGCTIANNTLAIKNSNPNGSMNFSNCSIDYNEQALILENDAMAFFTDCHFEWSKYTKPHFVLSTGVCYLKIDGGYMVTRPEIEYEEVPELDYVFDNTRCVSQGGVYLDGVHLGHIVTKFLFANPYYAIKNTKTYYYMELPSLSMQNEDFNLISSVVDGVIIPRNTSTKLSVSDNKIVVERIDTNNEIKFTRYIKINQDNFSPIQTFIRFQATKIEGGDCSIYISYTIKNKNGEMTSIKTIVDSFNLKDRLTTAGANNYIEFGNYIYPEKEIKTLLNNGVEIYLGITFIIFGQSVGTQFKFDRLEINQY